jgi:hypothetical protein
MRTEPVIAAFVLGMLSLVPAPARSQDASRDAYLKAFEARAMRVCALYDTSKNPGIYGAAVRYALGRDVRAADSLLMASDQIRRPSGDMFWMVPVIGTYLHGKSKMSAAASAAVRNALKTYRPYRGDTENHWCMYYTSLFLAAEQFPGLPGSEWYNGRTSDENRAEAKEYIIRWIEITTTIGQGEFDSPNYLPEYMMPMLLLGEFAQDPDMKQRGRMMADYLMADFAVDHLAGMFLGGHSREAPLSAWKPLLAPASDFAWLYFGTGTEKPSGWLALPAIADYRLPEIIYKIATDRSVPYVSTKKKRVRNVIRYGTEKNPPVYKYSYVTSDYGLSSLQGGILQPIQQHTWSVRFTACGPTSTIFGLHPYWSGEELAMFFPEEKKVLIADVVASKGTYNKDTKWTSSSPYEQTFQHRNTLIVLYSIPPGTTSEHIDGFFPKNLDERTVGRSGWIMCRAGDTYVGWYPLEPCEWMQLKQDEDNWRLRSHHLQNGEVLEVRSRRESGSFASFCAKLESHVPRKSLVAGVISVRYRTMAGDEMKATFGRPNELNGTVLTHAREKLFDSPFTFSEPGSQKLTLKYRSTRRVLDFISLTVTE